MSYAVGIPSRSAWVQILPPLLPGGSDLTLCLGLLICKMGLMTLMRISTPGVTVTRMK